MADEKKSKILIIGGTGYIGKFIVEASAKSGHPTFALVRESTLSDPVKGEIIQNFRNLGVTLVHGDLYNHDSLLKAIKQVDVVISAVGDMQIADQVKIIDAIKEAGNIKRFFPSEFGNDVVPSKSAFEMKAQIRTKIEAEGIPYTYVVSNAASNREYYIATYTIRAVDDPRVLNNILKTEPAIDVKKTRENTYISEEQILKYIKEAPLPFNFEFSIYYSLEITKHEDWFKGWLLKVGELLSEREEQIATLQKKCNDLEAESASLWEENKKVKKEASVFRSLTFILGVAFVSAVIGIVLGK